MLLAFIIWTIAAGILFLMGVIARMSKGPVGFFTGVKVSDIKDIKKYNRSVALLWFVYAFFFELLGIPLLFLKQNSAGFVLPILGSIVITIGLITAYLFILSKNKRS